MTLYLESINLLHFGYVAFLSLARVQSKCERYWCDEMNKPFEVPDRGFTVTMTGKKVYADYEIRDMTIKYVSAMEGVACVYEIVAPKLHCTSLCPSDR